MSAVSTAIPVATQPARPVDRARCPRLDLDEQLRRARVERVARHRAVVHVHDVERPLAAQCVEHLLERRLVMPHDVHRSAKHRPPRRVAQPAAGAIGGRRIAPLDGTHVEPRGAKPLQRLELARIGPRDRDDGDVVTRLECLLL